LRPESELIWQPPWGDAGLWISLVVGLAVLAFGVLSTAGRPPWVRAAVGALRTLAIAGVLLLLWRPTWQRADVTRGRDRVAVLVDVSASMELPATRGGTTRGEAAARWLAAARPTLRKWSERRGVDRFGFARSLGPLGHLVSSRAARRHGAPDARPTRSRSAGAPGSAKGAGGAGEGAGAAAGGGSESTGGAGGGTAVQQAARRSPSARREGTDLLGALEQVRQRYRGRQLAGVVVLSDGRDTARLREGVAGALRARLEALRVPVNVVPIGDPGLRDVSVAEVIPDDLAFARNVTRVRARVRVTGLTAAVDVSLWLDGERLQTRRLSVDAGAGEPEREVVFELTPPRVGTFTGRVVARPVPDEVTAANNVRRFVLRVVRDRVRVLQIAGRPSWDVRFLRQHFKRDPNVDLVSFFILRTHLNQTFAAPHELSLIQFPAEKLFSSHLDSFDLVVMQDFERYPAYVAAYLDNIAAWVRRGGALAVLGGEHTLTRGGFYGSALAATLPVALLPGGSETELLDEQPFSPRWTTLARQHPITSGGGGGASLSPARLQALPPLEGVNKVRRAHPDAAVLAVHPRLRTRKGEPMPVVAVRDVQRGRSLVLLTDTSWRWRFAASPGSAGTYDAFWRRVVRYLIGDPEFARLRVLASRQPYAAHQGVEVVIHASDPQRRPQAGVKVAWRLLRIEPRGDARSAATSGAARATGTGSAASAPPASAPGPAGGGAGSGTAPPDRGEPLRSGSGKTDESGRLVLALGPLAPGSYRVQAKAVLDDRAQRAEGVFVTEGEAPELARVMPAPRLLAAVAAATGGRVLSEAAALDRARLHEPRVIRLENVRSEPLVGSPWWLLLLITATLTGEWLLRRRFALA
jgi:uncharacterized membrane protein